MWVAPDDAWTWIERLSWIVALFGLPFGLYQVWAIRREVVRKAVLVVGFLPITHAAKSKDQHVPSTTCDLWVTFPLTGGLGESEELVIVVCNNGGRSARDVLMNAVFPATFPAESLVPRPGDPDPGGLFEADPLRGGGMGWIVRATSIHPRGVLLFRLSIRIPPGTTTFDLIVGASHEEAGVMETFKVTVHDRRASA